MARQKKTTINFVYIIKIIAFCELSSTTTHRVQQCPIIYELVFDVKTHS